MTAFHPLLDKEMKLRKATQLVGCRVRTPTPRAISNLPSYSYLLPFLTAHSSPNTLLSFTPASPHMTYPEISYVLNSLLRKPADSLWHNLTLNTSLTRPTSRDIAFGILSCVFSSMCISISQGWCLSLYSIPLNQEHLWARTFPDSFLSIYHNSTVSDICKVVINDDELT